MDCKFQSLLRVSSHLPVTILLEDPTPWKINCACVQSGITRVDICTIYVPVYGRSWVRFPSGTQIFSLSHARDNLNIPSLLKKTFSKNPFGTKFFGNVIALLCMTNTSDTHFSTKLEIVSGTAH